MSKDDQLQDMSVNTSVHVVHQNSRRIFGVSHYWVVAIVDHIHSVVKSDQRMLLYVESLTTFIKRIFLGEV